MMMHRGLFSLPLAVALASHPAPVLAQQGVIPGAPRDSGATARDSSTADPERRVRLARRGGGVRGGVWSVRGLDESSSTTFSETPAFEGYVRKGLDTHLALENSVGFWRRRQTITSSGPLGGTTTSTVDAYVVPQFTSLVVYPFTEPESRLEPYVRGGIGFAIGAEDQEGNGVTGGGTSFAPGFGATGGVGLQWRPGKAFGLETSARYQWIRFFQDFAGERTFQGLGIDVGVTYRFQFR
jgi:hypothetical protein